MVGLSVAVAPDSANSGEPSSRLARDGIRGTVWIGTQTVTVNLASLAVFIVLGRLLTPKEFGLVAAASVVILFLRILVDGGISKRLIQSEDVCSAMLDTAFWTAVAMGVALTAFILAAAPLIAHAFREPALTNVVRVMSCVLVFASLDRTQSALLDRRMAFRTQALRAIAAAGCSAALAIGGALLGWGVWALVIQTVSFELVNLGCLWSLSDWRPSLTWSTEYLKDLLSFGIRYMGIAVLQYLSLNGDNLLIGVFLGPTSLGYYVVAYRVLIVCNEALITTISRVGLAAFSRLQDAEAELLQATYATAELGAAIAMPIYAGIAVLAPELVSIVFGSKWSAAAPIMRVLCLAGMAQSLTSFTHPLVIAIGRVHEELRWNLVSCGLQISGFAASVHFGTLAVAWSLAASTLIVLPLRLVLLHRWTGTSISTLFRRLLGPLTATVAMIVAVMASIRSVPAGHVGAATGVGVVTGLVSYGAALALIARRTMASLLRSARSLHS